MYQIAKVAVENTAYHFDKGYTYLVPEGMHPLPGCRVSIPFGKGNRRRTGLVLTLEDSPSREKLKPLSALLDEAPLLTPELLDMLVYLKETTFCTYFDALRVLIPSGAALAVQSSYSLGETPPPLGLSPLQQELVDYLKARGKPVSESAFCKATGITPEDAQLVALLHMGVVIKEQILRQKILDEKICMVRLPDSPPEVQKPPTQKQRAVLAFLEQVEAASLKEVLYYTGTTRIVADNLQAAGAVEYFWRETFRNPYEDAQAESQTAPALSAEQQAAFEALQQQWNSGSFSTALLYGVTGSGKTQVFLKLVEHVLAAGKAVLVLVPEISLTAQTIASFHRRFGGRVAVLHSGLSLGERMDEWKRVRTGQADIVVGTRSAVFAPVERLGLVVIDEEQEHTYKSDQAPRFHARDIAKARCRRHGAMLLLCSATPSVESYYQAKSGGYSLVTLQNRYGESRLPDVFVVDMGDAANLSASPSISQHLAEELHFNLQNGQQSILLLNRRGYSTLVKCSACGEVASCPNCSVSLTFHTANNSLLCHYCGYTQPPAGACNKCGSQLLRYAGSGTQRLEEELRELYPTARILRVDMDTTMQRDSHQRLFSSFAQGEYDIMVGTQMVAKGLNFPNVTLVGVLNADQSLYSNDFRSFERSFSLLTQVVGRCGRGELPGRAVIQTHSPENPVIELASTQNYTTFFEQEIESRRLHLYPPFCTMAGIGFVGVELREVQKWSQAFLQELTRLCRTSFPRLPIRILGPVECEIVKAAGKYRYKLILKCAAGAETRHMLSQMQTWFGANAKGVSLFVDMYYDKM